MMAYNRYPMHNSRITPAKYTMISSYILSKRKVMQASRRKISNPRTR
jgi:hypothetical protein